MYADYAATHITKPECVKDAVMNALALGNSGRGVNESSLDAARKIYEVRTKVDQFFDGYGAEQVVFTSGITESLNTVIKGSLNHGDHVITTFMEHNSVLRPLYEMERQGVCLTITSPDVGDIKQAITKDTKMIVMTHASNVTGEMFDIQSVGKLCREKGILFVVDTAQSAGVIPISMKEDNIDILCFTGHKGLMGPQGIGGICIRKGVEIRPLKTGGTGILSFSKTQPGVLPQALEAGTLNGIGIVGLGAAIDFINTHGIDKIREQEMNLIEIFYKKIQKIQGIKIYHEKQLDLTKQTAICSINLEEYDSGSVSDELMERFQIQTRSGAHCAPLVHEHFGTIEQGMVRFSFGHETTMEEINQIINAVKILAEE
ncbi:aminotransferase class V-fold PLP-dependent enzyme [Anaerostipes hadrus]|uniref:aminotransferase class V-fold PLP-dependent enzyme n=1 Tax=Anaerostipes hadrus TaxID=649756 RepID=UPI002FE6DC05